MAAIAASSAVTPPPTLVRRDNRVIRYTKIQHLREIIDETIRYTTNDFLIVTDVSASCFAEIELNRRVLGKIRFRRYDNTSQILFITIPTGVHESLHLELYAQYMRHLVQNNLEGDWKQLGSTTFRPLGGGPGRGGPGRGGPGGEGDSTGGPKPARTKGWPTLVIEAGDSETMNELHNDMQWWFQASNHDVKIVLLAKWDRQGHQILLEKWEEDILLPPGAITQSRATSLAQQNSVPEPVLRQSIIITRDITTNPVSYNVTREALMLDFQLLFLRAPGPKQGDIIISIQNLQQYAADVWGSLL